MRPPRLRGGHSRRRQSGVVMYIALIVLIAMTMAGVAMMRQMGAGVSVAGNVAFKQNATSVADQGVEAAHAWYTAVGRDLWTSSPSDGYYANWATGFDPTQFTWTDDTSKLSMVASSSGSSDEIPVDPTGNEVRYILQRLCLNAGSPSAPGQQCSDSGLNQSIDKGGALPPSGSSPPVPYFRVTVRVKGPRNTVSYVQVIMN